MRVRVGARGAIALTQLLIATGVVVGGGAVGVGLQQAGVIGGGDETVEVALDAVPTLDCPGGSEIGELHRGDRVLATAKDAPGDFIEVRDPRNLSDRVWVASGYLVPDADLSGLDVHECVEEVATTTTSLAPTTTTTGQSAPPPDTAGPTIGAVSANPSSIAGPSVAGPNCQATSVVSVSATDPSGVSSVTVQWSAGTSTGTAVPQGGGYVVGPLNFQPNLPVGSAVTLTITAVDNVGNSSSVTNTTALKVC